MVNSWKCEYKFPRIKDREIWLILLIPPLTLWCVNSVFCGVGVHAGLCVISHYKHAIAGKLARTLLSGFDHESSNYRAKYNHRWYSSVPEKLNKNTASVIKMKRSITDQSSSPPKRHQPTRSSKQQQPSKTGAVNGHKKKQILLNAFDMSTVGHLSPGQWKVYSQLRELFHDSW